MKKIKGLIIMSSVFISIIVFLFVGSYVALLSEMNSVIDNPRDIDVMVILGAGLYGNEVSPQLSRRLDTAVEVLSKNDNIVTIVSGGQGDDEIISEAEAMKKYLTVDKKLRDNKIIKEDKSTSTFENLEYSKKIIDKLNVPSPNVAIVTSDYHLFRAKMIAERLGINNVKGYASKLMYIDYKTMIREILAIIKDWVLTLL